jgi:putative DNA primase/helicase
MDHAAEIMKARPSIPASLNDRAADICEPLLALADLAGGEWPELARQAVVGLTVRAEENNPIGSLLLDIWVLFVSLNAERLFTRTLVAGLNSCRERPWAELLQGKEITDLWLSKRLRPYGIRPKTIWIGVEHAKGYLQEECLDVFRRYIPLSEWESLKAEMLRQGPKDKDKKSEGGLGAGTGSSR